MYVLRSTYPVQAPVSAVSMTDGAQLHLGDVTNVWRHRAVVCHVTWFKVVEVRQSEFQFHTGRSLSYQSHSHQVVWT